MGNLEKLNLIELPGNYGICRLDPTSQIPDWAYRSPYYTVAHTPDELSILTSEEVIPAEVRSERGWRCLRLEGVFDFALVGILAKILKVLADAQISILAISTFDTDYILVKAENFEDATSVLKKAGYGIKSLTPNNVTSMLNRTKRSGSATK